MPTISEGNKILVSGANGYIGCHVVRTLLERNYAVRGVVRSPAKGRHLQELFKSYGEKFELAIVKDITEVSNICCISQVLQTNEWFRIFDI